MTSPLTTSLDVELTLHLEALYDAKADAVEDVVIGGLSRSVSYSMTEEERLAKGQKHYLGWRTVDLLSGVDTSSPAVIRLLSNLLSAVEAAASEALLAEAEG